MTGRRHWLMYVERLQKLYETLAASAAARAARRSASRRWVIERQEADGSWGGIQPPWVYSLIALNLMGYSLDHPVMRKGIEGMRRFIIDDARGLALSGLHVAGMGHRVGGARAGARGIRRVASGDAPRGELAACASRFPTMRPAIGA